MTQVPPAARPLRVAVFGQSLISDWNHGNAHFLRGLLRALGRLGHTVTFYEEAHNWSLANLIREQGPGAVDAFHAAFPDLSTTLYTLGDPAARDAWLRQVLNGADVVLVHEWNDPDLIRAIGRLGREFPRVTTLFHDTHYRAYSEPETMRALGLEQYGAVLAFSPSIAAIYRDAFGLPRVYVVHEAADVDLFRPLARPLEQDVVFIGNWGDRDRNEQVRRYFFEPSAALPDLRFALYGVRYEAEVRALMQTCYRIDYRGWVANYRTPEVYAASKMSLHIPRKQYTGPLHGTPTIRVFEVLACGLPLISLPWADTDRLFTAGADYLVAETPREMVETIAWLAHDPSARARIGAHARATILDRHTCLHRTQQILDIVAELRSAR